VLVVSDLLLFNDGYPIRRIAFSFATVDAPSRKITDNETIGKNSEISASHETATPLVDV
jgi:hypothetical protein